MFIYISQALWVLSFFVGIGVVLFSSLIYFIEKSSCPDPMYIYIYIYIYTHMYVCIAMYINMLCMCVYIYIYIHTYTHTFGDFSVISPTSIS